MANKWRPGCWIKNPNYSGDYWRKETKTIWVEFSTYRELKKDILSLFERNNFENIHVSRSRRGEWGEWFEIWNYNNGKPIIIKSGWM